MIDENLPDREPASSQNQFSDFVSSLPKRTVTISLETLLWATLAVAAVFLRFWALGERVMSHDESLHVYYSWWLASGKGFVHTPMMHGPFLFEATALLQTILGANDFASRLLPAVFGVFLAIVIPLLLRPWLGRIGSLAASLLITFSPFLLYFSRYNRHDILVITWGLLTFIAILGYMRFCSDRYLIILAISLALMFSSMEITFIYLAIFTGFLVMTMLAHYGFHWTAIRKSPEFDLVVILATLGAFFSAPIALLGLNPLWQRVSGQPFVPLSTLGSLGADWASGTSGERLWGVLGVFSAASLAVGWRWGKFRWLKLAGVFLAITTLLFSTFLTNPAGIGTGFIGSLGYWLSQQAVQRGGQPWFYYLIVFPFYEFVPIVLGSAAMIYFFFARKRFTLQTLIFVSFLTFWAFAILTALSMAGEKMPWLSTHLVIPWILLAGWGVDQFFLSIPAVKTHLKTVSRKVITLAAIVLLLVSIRSSLRVNFITFDYTTEPIDYAHGAPGVKWVTDYIAEIARDTGKGNNLVVAYDDQIAWPMSWYFRSYTGFFGADINPGAVAFADVVVVGSKNFDKADLFLGSTYKRYEVIRMWWPLEDYRNLTLSKVWSDLKDPQMRTALWKIFWDRDYSAYAALTNQPSIDPPRQWPLQDRMRIYVQNQLADQIPSRELAAYVLPQLPSRVDAYQNLQKDLQPTVSLSNLGLNAPRNLAFAPNGDLYVVDSGNDRVLRLNAKGEILSSFGRSSGDDVNPPEPGTFNEPWGIAVDASGSVYVADTWNHRIQKFNADGTYLLQWGAAGFSSDEESNFWGPRGIAISGDRVYVTDTGNQRVAVFTNEGQFLFDFDRSGDGQLSEPVGISIHQQHVYVADTWNQRVAVFSKEGKFLSSWPVQGWSNASPENKPFLAVDPGGNIFLSDPASFRIIEFTPEGKPLVVLGYPASYDEKLLLPNGISLDNEGRVWVADSVNNQILAYPIKP